MKDIVVTLSYWIRDHDDALIYGKTTFSSRSVRAVVFKIKIFPMLAVGYGI